MQTPEGQLSSKCTRLAHLYNVMCVKLTAGQGWPDKLFCFQDGRIMFVEFKVARGAVSKLQRATMRDLDARGLETHVVTTFDEFKSLLRLHGLRAI